MYISAAGIINVCLQENSRAWNPTPATPDHDHYHTGYFMYPIQKKQVAISLSVQTPKHGL